MWRTIKNTIFSYWNVLYRSRDRQNSQKDDDKNDEVEGLLESYKPTFFDEISRERSGGIDVSKHSKERRKFRIHTHEPTPSPKDDEESTTQRFKYNKKIRDDNGGEKPVLKIGIIFPQTIFKKREYERIIRSSLDEIDQEKCLHDENNDLNEDALSRSAGQEKSAEHENETRPK